MRGCKIVAFVSAQNLLLLLLIALEISIWLFVFSERVHKLHCDFFSFYFLLLRVINDEQRTIWRNCYETVRQGKAITGTAD